jgi:hypothetical protein
MASHRRVSGNWSSRYRRAGGRKATQIIQRASHLFRERDFTTAARSPSNGSACHSLLSGRGDFPENGLTPRARGCESFNLAAADKNVDSFVDHVSRALITRDTAAQLMQGCEERGRPGSAIDRRQNGFKRKRHLRLRHQLHRPHRPTALSVTPLRSREETTIFNVSLK